MANTYYKIDTATGDGTNSQVDFVLIPNTYTDLMMRISGKTTTTSNLWDSFYVRFNNDSGANYTTKRYLDNQGTATANSVSSQTELNTIGYVNTSHSTTPYVASLNTLYIMNYAQTQKKPVWVNSIQEGFVDTTEIYSPVAASGIWSGTAAITTISVYCGRGAWTTATSFDLYGIKST